MHVLSLEADTAYSLLVFTCIAHTLPLCSFKEAFITYVCLLIYQTLTSPSLPPLIIFYQSEVDVIAVTPCTWASFITYNNFPDYGKNPLIFPSLHPLIICLPSFMNPTQLHSKLGTSILNSSYLFLLFHILISFIPQVANTSE